MLTIRSGHKFSDLNEIDDKRTIDIIQVVLALTALLRFYFNIWCNIPQQITPEMQSLLCDLKSKLELGSVIPTTAICAYILVCMR